VTRDFNTEGTGSLKFWTLPERQVAHIQTCGILRARGVARGSSYEQAGGTVLSKRPLGAGSVKAVRRILESVLVILPTALLLFASGAQASHLHGGRSALRWGGFTPSDSATSRQSGPRSPAAPRSKGRSATRSKPRGSPALKSAPTRRAPSKKQKKKEKAPPPSAPSALSAGNTRSPGLPLVNT
jgi:hypothetical protein